MRFRALRAVRKADLSLLAQAGEEFEADLEDPVIQGQLGSLVILDSGATYRTRVMAPELPKKRKRRTRKEPALEDLPGDTEDHEE